MDDDVKPQLYRHIAAVLLVLAGNSYAESLPDPTRPPAILTALRSGTSLAAATATPAGPQLQSVLIARHAGGRHVAVIDGQMVKLGDKYRGAVLARMTDSEVELVSGTTRQVLKLYPAPVAQK